ncbi:MAG: DUF1292 domain-containing protein [Clostridia bacterium]|nr:DUF1292 domain-containing protein [Clostridia bacterium]
MEENKVIFTDENGVEHEFELIFTFDSEATGKSYAVLGKDDGEGGLDIVAASYVPTEGEELGELNPIESDEEWEMVEDTIDSFFEETAEE